MLRNLFTQCLAAIGMASSLAVSVRAVRAQDTRPLELTAETRYYDFWAGTWHEVVNGRVDTSATRFVVTRAVHPAAYLEEWRMVIDSATTLRAVALRAWDKTTSRWMYTWVSDNGLFQQWDGVQVGGDWYIQREFNIEGDRFLSRQAWIPTGPNRLMRVMERSRDGGRTWQPRSRQEFVKTGR